MRTPTRSTRRRKRPKVILKPPSPAQRHFGTVVRSCRQRLGWSQQQLAAYLRYADKGMISMIEHGLRTPTLWRVALLLQLCDIPLPRMYGLGEGTQPAFPYDEETVSTPEA